MARMIALSILIWPALLYNLLIRSRPGSKASKFTKFGFFHRIVVGVNRRGRVKVDAHGVENLPAEDGFIMFPNHQGLYDILTLLQTCDRPFSIVVKKETADVFWLKKVLQCLDCEFMDREDIRQSMKIIQNVARRVSENRDNFVIFPEGTRGKQGNNMLEFKHGSFKAATMAKCPIVPVALIDSFIPFDSGTTAPATVQLHILEPIPYEAYKDMKTGEIAAMVQERIRQKITEATGIESKIVQPLPAAAKPAEAAK